MDVPDILTHFFMAAEYAEPAAMYAFSQAAENMQDVMAAFSQDSPWGTGRKLYELSKIGLYGGILCSSLLGRNLQGTLSSTFAMGEHFYKMNKVGETVRRARSNKETQLTFRF